MIGDVIFAVCIFTIALSLPLGGKVQILYMVEHAIHTIPIELLEAQAVEKAAYWLTIGHIYI